MNQGTKDPQSVPAMFLMQIIVVGGSAWLSAMLNWKLRGKL
jgi:hypothetical protein